MCQSVIFGSLTLREITLELEKTSEKKYQKVRNYHGIYYIKLGYEFFEENETEPEATLNGKFLSATEIR